MKILPIPCSFDNYSYLLYCEDTKEGAVVDPTEAYLVMREVEKRELTLKSVFCTHHHHDHVGDIGSLLAEYGDLEVVCHVSDRQRIQAANSFVEDGDKVTVGLLQGQVLCTPGHTSGSICYHFDDALITGDTLFGAGCGRLFEGTAEQMLQSLKRITDECDDQTRIYFGHEYTRKNLEFSLSVEPTNTEAAGRLEDLDKNSEISTPSTLELEKMTNPFLRSSEETVRKGLELRGLHGLVSGLDVFTQLRLLRNDF